MITVGLKSWRAERIYRFTVSADKQSAKPALVIELKWNKSGEKAIRQGEEQQYWKFAETFRYKGPILLVGINYKYKNKETYLSNQRSQEGIIMKNIILASQSPRRRELLT